MGSPRDPVLHPPPPPSGLLSACPMFGSSFFYIQSCSNHAIVSPCILAVNQNGLSFLSKETHVGVGWGPSDGGTPRSLLQAGAGPCGPRGEVGAHISLPAQRGPLKSPKQGQEGLPYTLCWGHPGRRWGPQDEVRTLWMRWGPRDRPPTPAPRPQEPRAAGRTEPRALRVGWDSEPPQPPLLPPPPSEGVCPRGQQVQQRGAGQGAELRGAVRSSGGGYGNPLARGGLCCPDRTSIQFTQGRRTPHVAFPEGERELQSRHRPPREDSSSVPGSPFVSAAIRMCSPGVQLRGRAALGPFAHACRTAASHRGL